MGAEFDPMIVGIPGRIFLGTQDPNYGPSNVTALDSLTGNTLWQQRVSLPVSILTGDNNFYVGEDDDIISYNSGTGQVMHELTLPNIGPFYRMYFSEENIFALTGTSRYVIYNVSSGSTNLSQPYIASAPYIMQSGVLYLGNIEGLQAQDTSTKQILWTYKPNFNEPSSKMKPLFTRDHVITLTTLGSIYAINKKTGVLNWKIGANAIGNVASDGTNLYFLASDGFLVVIDEATGIVIGRVAFSNGPFTIGDTAGYNIWVDSQNKIVVASFGDSCQLIALKMENP